jgi:hypothetical protein
MLKQSALSEQSFTHRNKGHRCTLREYDARLPRPPAVMVTGSVLGRTAASLTSRPRTTSQSLQFYPTPKSNFLQSPALSLALCYDNCCKHFRFGGRTWTGGALGACTFFFNAVPTDIATILLQSEQTILLPSEQTILLPSEHTKSSCRTTTTTTTTTACSKTAATVVCLHMVCMVGCRLRA